MEVQMHSNFWLTSNLINYFIKIYAWFKCQWSLNNLFCQLSLNTKVHLEIQWIFTLLQCRCFVCKTATHCQAIKLLVSELSLNSVQICFQANKFEIDFFIVNESHLKLGTFHKNQHLLEFLINDEDTAVDIIAYKEYFVYLQFYLDSDIKNIITFIWEKFEIIKSK